MPRLSAPVVLVTGDLTGIGRAAAVAFAKKGAKVVVAGPRDEATEALVTELLSYGSDVEFVAAAHQDDAIDALIDTSVARFDRLDVAPDSLAAEGSAGPTEGKAQVPHQVVEAGVRISNEQSTIAKLVYLQSSEPPAVFSALQFSFTPLQSLRLARDFLAVAEHFIVPQGRKRRAHQSRKTETS